MALRHHREVSS